jgi:hypothetical protein
MQRFKVGDRVTIKKTDHCQDEKLIGENGTIDFIWSSLNSYGVILDNDPREYIWNEKELELISSNTRTPILKNSETTSIEEDGYRTTEDGFKTNNDNWQPGKWLI